MELEFRHSHKYFFSLHKNYLARYSKAVEIIRKVHFCRIIIILRIEFYVPYLLNAQQHSSTIKTTKHAIPKFQNDPLLRAGIDKNIFMSISWVPTLIKKMEFMAKTLPTALWVSDRFQSGGKRPE